jgi:hypothetical protein
MGLLKSHGVFDENEEEVRFGWFKNLNHDFLIIEGD